MKTLFYNVFLLILCLNSNLYAHPQSQSELKKVEVILWIGNGIKDTNDASWKITEIIMKIDGQALECRTGNRDYVECATQLTDGQHLLEVELNQARIKTYFSGYHIKTIHPDFGQLDIAYQDFSLEGPGAGIKIKKGESLKKSIEFILD